MAQPTYDELVRENQRLRERLGALEAQVVRLTQLLEQATRKGKRQAAPFSKGLPKPDPKRPGRKPGPDYHYSAKWWIGSEHKHLYNNCLRA